MSSDARSHQGATPLAYVTCTVTGEAVKPEFWTNYFGVSPDVSVEKGKPFLTPSGRMSSSPGRSGVWGRSTRTTMTSENLDAHIENLVSVLGLPRLDLPALLAKHHAKMYFTCYWNNHAGNRIPVFEEKWKGLIQSSGGNVEIDEYPKPLDPS